jgi:hypothetical protein
MPKKKKFTKRVNNPDPVKKNMDKFTRPSTHIDRKKEAKKNGNYYT